MKTAGSGIGLCGHQPGLGEIYISTGSLYLASTAFLPLGLPESDEFWSAPAEPWSSVKIWSGCDLPGGSCGSGPLIRAAAAYQRTWVSVSYRAFSPV